VVILAFTKEELKRIMAALKKKAPKPENCPICGNENWQVGDEFVALVLQEDAKNLKLTGAFLPCIPVSCSNCGNTHLLSLITLGLRDLFEGRKGEKKEEKPKVE